MLRVVATHIDGGAYLVCRDNDTDVGWLVDLDQGLVLPNVSIQSILYHDTYTDPDKTDSGIPKAISAVERYLQ